MPAKLTFYPTRRAARLVLVQDGETLTLGRDPECSVVLDDAGVSKRHATLRGSPEGWRLADDQSKNGTRVNGEPAKETLLRSGDRIDLGGLSAVFDLLTSSQAATIASERLERIQTTAAMRRRLGSDLEPRGLLALFLESAVQVTKAERGFVLLVGPGGGLRVEAATGFLPRQVRDSRFRGSMGALREAFISGAPVLVSDVSTDPFFGKRTSVISRCIGSLACLPLRRRGEVIGLLYLDGRSKVPAFTDVDLEILESLADHTVAVLTSHPAEQRFAEPGGDVLVAQLQRRIEELLPLGDFA